jgi:hypothetical protein
MTAENAEEAAVTLADVSNAGLSKALGRKRGQEFDAVVPGIAASSRSYALVCGVSAVLATEEEDKAQRDQKHAQHDECSAAVQSVADVAGEWIAEEHAVEANDDDEFCWEEDEEADDIELVRIQVM